MVNARNEWKMANGLRATQAEPIAIVGMAVDLPGAASVEQFWDNLRSGVESITPLTEDELIAAGEDPARIRHRDYVAAAARLDGFDEFDAEFFGFSAKEAAILDPQHRKFMEVAWHALEHAGHVPDAFPGNIGVYAGCGMGSYFYFNICSNPDLVEDVGMFLLRHTGNDKDFLSTRVSHIFDLEGPSVNIQTACSTSLVAVHTACEALRKGDCDMALAGGVTIELPQGRGYLFKDNEILSPDGHCHAFDHRAQGTVFGSGAGAVTLRRLSDAIADGDHIWGVIRGSAINNDGGDKASYLAPSVDGQARAITRALDVAGVEAGSVDYVECHGTGTYLGDPIEVSALTQAFRHDTKDTGFCGIGSVKTNIGHLDTAAGIASLVKTTLGLHHKQIPPSLGYEAPNPTIDFDTSPFRVNDTLRDWDGRGTPRRAGVNSLGVGGTNAHALLEEAPERAASGDSDWPFHVLCVSGRSKAALEANSRALAAHLRAHPEQPLADVAHTLKNGRKGFEKRRVLVAKSHDEAADLLESGDTRRVFTHDLLGENPELVFMFPGGGAQYPDMARDLYETEPVFADWMDRGLDHLQAQLDYDIRALWLPEPQGRAAAEEKLKQPSVQLPLIMIVEYALAQLWISWGVKPAALVGHSMGENTAAALAGVMTFENCIDLVLLRGRLFDTVAPGGMLSVSLPASELENLVGDDLDIASVNAPELSAVSGPQDRLDAFAGLLDRREVDYQRVAIDIAAHSRMLDPILNDFRAFLSGLDLKPPQMPILSNRSGAVMTAEQATSPDYWTEQLRNCVQFGACIDALAAQTGRVFLEVGPGKALSALAQMNPNLMPGQVLSSLRHPDQNIADDAYFLGVVGRLWACGVVADWDQIWGEARRNRVPLPGYAFRRKRYFIEPRKGALPDVAPALMRKPDIADWGWQPVWRAAYADSALTADTNLSDLPPQTWLFFDDELGLSTEIARRLTGAGHKVVCVRSADTTGRASDGSYTLAPEMGTDAYETLFRLLAEAGELPDRIGHFWLVTGHENFRPGSSFFDRNMEHGFYSLMYLAQALGNADLSGPVHVSVITNGAEQVRDEALPYPEKSIVTGAAGVIPRELPGITCATLDIELPQTAAKPGGLFRREPTQNASDMGALAARVIEDLLASPDNIVAAYRGDRRLVKSYGSAPLIQTASQETGFRRGGTYLITGGFGGIGLTMARDLLSAYGANVVLLTRSTIPKQEDWEDYLARHPASDKTARHIREAKKLEESGGRLIVANADICNRVAMQQVRDTVEAQLGPITGVIHAAGAIDDGPLMTKTEAAAEAVMAPKITGLRVLDALFPDGALELMVLCASSSTATRPAGQIDYAAANTYLNAFARSRAGAKTRVIAVDWGVWSEVGMAADAMASRTGDVPEPAWMPAVGPLLDSYCVTETGRSYRGEISARQHWLIDGHRTKAGDAMLPGTGYIELAAQALAAQGITAPFEIRDLHFLRPLEVADGTARRIELHLTQSCEGFEFETRGGVALNGRSGTVLNAQALLTPAPDTAAGKLDLTAITARCPARETAAPGDRLRAPQEAHLDFGPRWHVLRATALGDREGLAHLSLPLECGGDLDAGYILHPGLLDPATGWAMRLIPEYVGTHLWVPVSYSTIRIHRPLPAEIVSWVRLPEGEVADGFASFDITLVTPGGEVCVDIAGFQMKRLDGQAAFGTATSLAETDIAFDDAGQLARAPLSPEEERLHHNITQGIAPEDGPEALRRALALGRSQVIVSSLDLDGLIAQAGQSAMTANDNDGQSFERPDLDGDFVAPRDTVEETLAGFWEKLLGVSPVGVEDSFFDLGGHSLIAVRLFAMIKREFEVEFPISVLFEAPTIADCARLIQERTGRSAAPTGEATPQGGDTARRTEKPAPQGFTHLVALNRAEGSAKPPMFIVAGMFGNVLNLRHLAQQLGSDQPVYGLQAKGLTGDDEPHVSIVQAARDYLAEIRKVRPEGPYLLGGFSGGGITAYEMAQQLETAGEEVAVLALLDTPLPVRPPLSRRDKALIKLQEFRRKGLGYLREWVVNRLEWERRKRRVNDDPADAGRFHNRKIEMAFRQAVGSYTLSRWDGPLLLFRPPLDRHWQVSDERWVSRAREYVFHDNEWTGWAPQTEVVEIPGDHDSMVLDPNVKVLAARLAAEIAMATGAGRAMNDAVTDWIAATAAE